MKKDKIRLTAILLVSIFVIITGTLFTIQNIKNQDIAGAILGAVIAITILAFAIYTYRKGQKDIKEGYPLKDERSRKVVEKASSLSFMITIYALLLIGFLSDNIIKFRDISQAISVSVGVMALIFLISWIYYNNKEL